MGRQTAKQRVAQIFPLGAPVRGIDDTSSLANMDPLYAIDMMNLFPEAGSLRVRHGYQLHAENMTANGKTIMTFNAPGGTTEIFCATDDGIYDVTSETSAPSIVHALTDGYVSWTMFSNIAGHWLIGCNGVDAPFIYDGTTWDSFVNDPAPSAPGEILTGTVLVEDLIAVHVHKNRLWFIEKDTLSAWYLNLNAVSGDATEFPLGGIFSLGGQLKSMFSITFDSGVGSDDVLVFQSSKGELGGYAGSNPDTVLDWGLIARFFVGSPLGDRTNVQLSGDVLLLTEFGVISALGIIEGRYQLGAEDSKANVSSRISRTISRIVRERNSEPAWEILTSSVNQYVIINIQQFSPETSAPQPAFQLVMNSVTGAWTKFDLPAITMYGIGQLVYFTDAFGRVWKYGAVEVDNLDFDSQGGTRIVSSLQQAYSYLDMPTINKHFKFLRPIVEAAVRPGISVSISTDYSPTDLSTIPAPSGVMIQGALWDDGLWDAGLWTPSIVRFETLVGVYGIGYSASLLLKMSSATTTKFVSSNWVFEPGISL